MTPESIQLLESLKKDMAAAIVHLEHEFGKLRTGKASPAMLEGLKVDYYGALTPVDQVANVQSPDAKTIIVQPWDKSLLPVIDKAIQAANLGFNPQNNGEVLRIVVPALTEERRKELVKKAKNEAENARVSIRNIRRIANETAKKLEKSGVPEDEITNLEKEIQNQTNQYIQRIDKFVETKEKDIMTV